MTPQTLTPTPIATLADRFGAGLCQLECHHRWFIISALANHLLNGQSFEIIVDRLDPDTLVDEWVCELLYELDGSPTHHIWALLKAIVHHIEES